jgi:hypothetical protein
VYSGGIGTGHVTRAYVAGPHQRLSRHAQKAAAAIIDKFSRSRARPLKRSPYPTRIASLAGHPRRAAGRARPGIVRDIYATPRAVVDKAAEFVK